MRTQDCSIKGPCPFPRGDNYEMEKKHWQNFFKNLLCFKIRFIFLTGKQETQNWHETDTFFYWHNILTIDLSILLSIVAISSTLAMILSKISNYCRITSTNISNTVTLSLEFGLFFENFNPVINFSVVSARALMHVFVVTRPCPWIPIILTRWLRP